jgi:hypothetical protein
METVTGVKEVTVPASQKTQRIFTTNSRHLTQFRETALCGGQGAEPMNVMNVEAGGMYSYRCAVMANSTERPELVLLFVCRMGA